MSIPTILFNLFKKNLSDAPPNGLSTRVQSSTHELSIQVVDSVYVKICT